MEEGTFTSDKRSDGTNTEPSRFVEFESANDLKTAVEKLDGREFKGSRVTCTADVGSNAPPYCCCQN